YVVMETVIERRLTARVPVRSADPRRHSPVPVRMRRKLRCEPDLTRTATLTCGANSHAPPDRRARRLDGRDRVTTSLGSEGRRRPDGDLPAHGAPRADRMASATAT